MNPDYYNFLALMFFSVSSNIYCKTLNKQLHGGLKFILSLFRRRASFTNQMFYVSNLLKYKIKVIIAHIKSIRWKAFKWKILLEIICLRSSQLHCWSGSSVLPVREFILITSCRKLS